MQRPHLLCMLAGSLVGSLATAAWASWGFLGSTASRRRRRAATQHQQAFVLMVTLTFEKVQHKEEFLTFWRPLADHVRAHEPGTLAFELLQLDTDPTSLLVYERYVDKGYYLNTHRTSAPMAAFKQRLAAAAWEVQISGRSYNELNIGFM